MQAADSRIDQIVRSSGIPSPRQRQEVVRELRSHVADLVESLRGAGHSEAEIEKMVLDRLGDPRGFGNNFGWVYRRERVVVSVSVFVLSTIAVGASIAAGTLVAQAGVLAGFGIPISTVLRGRHTVIEAADILATVGAYVALRQRWPLAIAVLAALVGLSLAAGVHTPFLVFGTANAVFLRAAEFVIRRRSLRFGSVSAAFGLFGGMVWSTAAATVASWAVMGMGYQLMTVLAARVDREVSRRVFGL